MTASLAGAFASSKNGLGQTKQQKKEQAEIEELLRMAEPPTWAAPSLLADLRSGAAEASATLASSPIDVREAVIPQSKAIARVAPSATVKAKAGQPTGDYWAVLLKPGAAGAPPDEEVVMCLGQDADGKLRGAIGWWPAGARKAAGDVFRAADAARCVPLDDAAGEYPAEAMPHPTVTGVGENNKEPGPATSDTLAPIPLQLAETTRMYHVSRAQINARMQRGGASSEEKGYTKGLLVEALERIELCSMDAELPKEDLLRCESAVQGLRKAYLRREWESRCSFCGTRHSIVEKGSCKFWVAWQQAIKDKEAQRELLRQ